MTHSLAHHRTLIYNINQMTINYWQYCTSWPSSTSRSYILISHPYSTYSPSTTPGHTTPTPTPPLSSHLYTPSSTTPYPIHPQPSMQLPLPTYNTNYPLYQITILIINIGNSHLLLTVTYITIKQFNQPTYSPLITSNHSSNHYISQTITESIIHTH